MRGALVLVAGCGRLGFEPPAAEPVDAPPIDTMIDAAPDASPAVLCADDFAAPNLDPHWQILDAQSPFPAGPSAGALHVTLSAGTASYNGILSAMPIDAGGATHATIELVQPVSQGGFVDCGFGVESETAVRYQFGIGGGNLVMRIDSDQMLVPYNPTAHRHLRITHDSGTVTWETSADRATWMVQRTASVTPLTQATVLMFAGAFAVGSPDPGEAIFDRFALTSPDCP